MTINWLTDAIIIIIGTPCLALLVCILAAIRLSGNISRAEEEQEAREAFQRLKLVA